MKHILAQGFRLLLGLAGLGVAAAAVATSVHWVTNIHELAGPQGLTWEATPFTSHVSFPLDKERVRATYGSRWREGHRLVRLDTPVEPLVDLAPEAFETLMGGQRLLVQGLVTSGIPLVISYTTSAHEILERLPVDAGRSLRVYLFYYLLFVPLSVGPLLGYLAWTVLSKPGLPAGLFWALLGACLAWGVLMVWAQERVMKRPARKTG